MIKSYGCLGARNATKRDQPKKLATTGAHRLCCLQASRTWTLSLSEPFPEVLMTWAQRAVEIVDFAKLSTYHAQMACIIFGPDHWPQSLVVWLDDQGARPCWALPILYSIDSIKVQNDDMQKQHRPGRHCHPVCTCKATAGSAKVERSFPQTSVGFAFHSSDCLVSPRIRVCVD